MATAEKDLPRQQTILSSLARLTGAGNDQKKTNVEFIYMSNPSWPISGGMTARGQQKMQRPIRISVLDSSFNPPTKAHLALASSPPPRSRQSALLALGAEQAQDGRTLSNDITMEAESMDSLGRETYDAHMLLLSVTNADKKLKEGDATYLQRLVMMILLSREIQCANGDVSNLCIAAIDEPTFVGKSRKLRHAIAHRISTLSDQDNAGLKGESSLEAEAGRGWEPELNLYFVLGFDTVTRLFDPRFYGSKEAMKTSLGSFFAPVSEGGDGSYVVCARRNATHSTEGPNRSNESIEEAGLQLQRDARLSCAVVSEEELQFFRSAEVRDYWENGKVSLMEDIESELQGMSSTLARNAEAAAAGSRESELRRLLPASVVEYILQQSLYRKQM